MAKVQCVTCGGMADLGNSVEAECPYCGCTVTLRRISSFTLLEDSDFRRVKAVLEKSGDGSGEKRDLPLGLCYLKIGNFELAKKKFLRVMEESPECAEGYFYYALTLLRGKDLGAITMNEAREVGEYLKTAMALDEKFLFPKLLYGLLCLEYYLANDLTPPADGEEILRELGKEEFNEQEFLFFRKMIRTKVI